MTETAGTATFREAVQGAVSRMMKIEHRPHASFVRTPLLYPSGKTVMVQCRGTQNAFHLSDAAFGYQEAELLGATSIYARWAQIVSKSASVLFDSSAFHILDVSQDQLAGAIMTVAACSQEAAAITARRFGERSLADMAEELLERLLSVFRPSSVQRDVRVVGYSHTEWQIAAMVAPDEGKKPIIFEPVTGHQTSVAYASMKFADIARAETPPRRVAVVRRKAELGTLLGVLSQSASVIDLDAPRTTFSKLVNVA